MKIFQSGEECDPDSAAFMHINSTKKEINKLKAFSFVKCDKHTFCD